LNAVFPMINRLKKRIENLNDATEGATLIQPTIFPVASEAAIRAAEAELGLRLPSLLRDIYKQVGNGGFGPGYGLLGVPGGATDDLGNNIVDLYHWYRKGDPTDPHWRWPASLVPICHLGCAMYACVDCNEDAGRMIWFEPNLNEEGEPWDSSFISLADSLEIWLDGWLQGKKLLDDASISSHGE
jgi:hypothetical protein